MHPPENTEVLDFGTSLLWLSPPGIIYVKSVKDVAPDLYSIKLNIATFKAKFGDKKWCFLMDLTNRGPASKEMRDFSAEEFPKFIKALALISDSPLGRMVANLFFAIKKQPYPVKMFNEEQEAKDWLMHYL
jgi:hypothetical protein